MIIRIETHKHRSSGPWKAEGSNVTAADGFGVCLAATHGSGEVGEAVRKTNESNLALIVAAPELLAAAIAVAFVMEDDDPLRQILVDAIAKATVKRITHELSD